MSQQRPRLPKVRWLIPTLVLAILAVPAGVLASHSFTDVPDSHTFHDDIGWMLDNGITTGCGPAIYCPADNVTRGQMAAFMRRLATLRVVDAATALDADRLGGVAAADYVEEGETDTVTAAMIQAGAVRASEIDTGAVRAAEIASDAVGAAEIATDAVGAAEIATNAVGAAEIATDAVGAAEIATDAVGAAEIATGAVRSAEVANDTLTAVDLRDEPGGAQTVSSTFVDLSTALTTISEVTIDAPTAGVVLVGATAEIQMSHVNGTQSRLNLAVLPSSQTNYNSDEDHDIGIPSTAATGLYIFTTSVSKMFPVDAGSHTYKLVANTETGNLQSAADDQLWAVFVPTSYGTVGVSSLTPAGSNQED